MFSYVENRAPFARIFVVDFKYACDQLWFDGCLAKLARMGILHSYIIWIRALLTDRRAIFEIHGKKSKCIDIKRGGPQGSCFTPTLLITYHYDMAEYIPTTMSFVFADDLAVVLAGQMGIKYTEQCLDLERRLSTFME